MVYKCFDKKTLGGSVTVAPNKELAKELAKELHKPIIKNFGTISLINESSLKMMKNTFLRFTLRFTFDALFVLKIFFFLDVLVI